MTSRYWYCCAFLFTIASWIPAVTAFEGPWPQWQGPHRDAVSDEKGLLQTWPEGGPPQAWLSRDCGLGYAGPAIVGNRLYILGAREDQEVLLCLNAETGQEIWATPLGPTYENSWGDGPRSTPTIEGEFIYTLATEGNLTCLTKDAGEIVWKKELQEFGGEIPQWGYSESPLIHNEKLLVTPGGSDGAIIAVNKANGDFIWQTPELTDIAHYSSIVTTEQGGREIGVQMLVSQLVGFDLEDGKVYWSIPWPGRVAAIPTPIIWNDYVYATAGYGAGCMLVKLNQDLTADKIYDNKLMVNHHGGVIRIGECVYGFSDRKGWTCQDLLTGEKRWQDRKVLGKGAIGYADGHFYCISEDEGEVVLINASEEGWQEDGRFTLTPQTELRKPKGRIWVHPVIADGKLYLRDQELLFCFDVEAK